MGAQFGDTGRQDFNPGVTKPPLPAYAMLITLPGFDISIVKVLSKVNITEANKILHREKYIRLLISYWHVHDT